MRVKKLFNKILSIFFVIYFAFPPLVYAQDIATASAQEISTPSATPTEVTPTPTPLDWSELLTPEPTTSSTPAISPFVESPATDMTPSPTIFQSPSSAPSATLRLPMKIRKLSRNTFQSIESVEVVLESDPSVEYTATVLDSKGKNAGIAVEEKIRGSQRYLRLSPTNRLTPGLYTLHIRDWTGNIINESFSWGLLAVNFNKSVYVPGDKATIFIGILDDKGATVCDADITLTVRSPDDTADTFSTDQGTIQPTMSCGIPETNSRAEYEGTYTLGRAGTYALSVTVKSPAGTYTIEDAILVRDNVPLRVERIEYPGRFNPAREIEAAIRITANEDFSGQITETVPDLFDVASSSATPYDFLVSAVSTAEGIVTNSSSPQIIRYPFEGTYSTTLEFGEQLVDSEQKSLYEQFGLAGHDGIDFALPEGTNVIAVDDGVVALAGRGAYGITVVLQHTWGKSYYGHLQGTGLAIGQKVLKSQSIGRSGSTGLATGSHLHFGMKFMTNDTNNGYYGKVDPMPYVSGLSVFSGYGVRLVGWNITLKKGQSKILYYRFNAPDTHPQIYTVGPLRIGSGDTAYVENRPWQTIVEAPPEAPIAASDVLGQQADAPKAEKSVIRKGKPVNTNLKENAKALKRSKGEKIDGVKDTDTLFRWDVELSNRTMMRFGRQEKGGIAPSVKMQNKEGWFVEFTPINSGMVTPKVNGNQAEWEIAPGVTAQYKALTDRMKADYVISTASAMPKDNTLQFTVHYNDEYAGDTAEEATSEASREKGFLHHELKADGSIAWIGENDWTYYTNPAPVVSDATGKAIGARYDIKKVSTGTSELSILLDEKDVAGIQYPVIIDPVTIDSAASATVTAYANGRQILRDAWGNLIIIIEGGTGSDSIYYKNYSATSWTDAAIALGSAADATNQLSSDLDSNGNLHIVYYDDTAANTPISYQSYTVVRDASNTITSLSALTAQFNLDTSGKGRRPSLIIANKGEGAGKEKVAVAWAMNSTSGGTKRGEIRFLQCDVADGCDTAAEWKNASEAKNGNTDGMSTAIGTPGAADVVLQVAAHTTHHGVITQVPGRPARTPTNAKKDDNGSFSNLSNTIDDNTGTGDSISTFDTTDYLYIGDSVKFSRIVVDLSAANAQGSRTLSTVEYCSAESGGTCSTWSAVSNFIDNTYNATTSTPLMEDGSLLFDEPSSWVANTVDGVSSKYWIRLRPSGIDVGGTIAEIDVTDRHSHDLLIAATSNVTDPLGSAYVIWDFIGQAGWENIPGNTTAPAPWRLDESGISAAGSDYSTYTNFPLSLTTDYINNRIYIGFIAGNSGPTRMKHIPNNLSLTSAVNWSTIDLPTMTEGADMTMSLSADQNDIYLFYIVDAGSTALVYVKCDPKASNTRDVCDNASDLSAEQTLDSDTTLSHPQAIVSKAFGDTTAIDVIYTDTTDTDVRYERHYVNMADKTIVVAASGDDATNRDCIDLGTDIQTINGSSITLGGLLLDASCSNLNAEYHAGFRFPAVNVSQGSVISSAYLDFRITTESSANVDFTIYGEDADDSAAYTAVANCSGDTNCVDNRTKTTTNSVQSVTLKTQSHRFDVTDMVQEIICRGAGSSQPCVGNYNGSGTWALGNDLSLLLIASVGESVTAAITAQDATGTMLDPTLQINTGATGKRYSMGVLKAPAVSTDLDHPMSQEQFSGVGTDDAVFASVSASLVPSASSSANPIFQFKVNNTNNNNTDNLSATAIVKSSITTKTNEYQLLSSAYYDNISKSIGSEDNGPTGLAFKSDGTKMYMVGIINGKVYQYTLSKAWDISTATYDNVFKLITGENTSPHGISFSSDGTKMYMVGITSSATVYQYSLNPGWDLSTANYDSVSKSVNAQDISATGLAFKNDGTKMYIIGAAGDTVYQYSLNPGWDLSTANYDSVFKSITTEESSPYDLSFKSDGTKMYIIGTSSTVYQYSLSTAWDLSTATYDGVSKSITAQDTNPNGIVLKSDDSKIYTIGDMRNNVFQYTLGRTFYLQLYHTTNGWETKDTESATAADTDITLSSGVVSSTTSNYSSESPGGSCTGSDCWAAWRVYQDAAPEANQILYVDNFSATFPTPTPTPVSGPTIGQIMRHGKWFNASGVEQPFAF